ncbi:transposase [Glycomyces buryatensis]|uniref:transposase n=1 Tax=Glycomyces buryatensis TaxID=2570927 RepID=UPI002482FF23|nr:transposase [Glycomyces buryatensis]
MPHDGAGSYSVRRLAAFDGVASKQIASGANNQHRLDRLGNHYLKRAVHTVAMVQARLKSGPGRVYYLKKIDEGKPHREALRCLKRQLIKVIWRMLRADAHQRESVALAA